MACQAVMWYILIASCVAHTQQQGIRNRSKAWNHLHCTVQVTYSSAEFHSSLRYSWLHIMMFMYGVARALSGQKNSCNGCDWYDLTHIICIIHIRAFCDLTCILQKTKGEQNSNSSCVVSKIIVSSIIELKQSLVGCQNKYLYKLLLTIGTRWQQHTVAYASQSSRGLLGDGGVFTAFSPIPMLQCSCSQISDWYWNAPPRPALRSQVQWVIAQFTCRDAFGHCDKYLWPRLSSVAVRGF